MHSYIYSACTVHYIPLADRVIALEGGRIALQGTYEELSAQGYDLKGVLARSSIDQNLQSASSQKDTTATQQKAQEDPASDGSEDDETTISYDKGGANVYKFYASHGGYLRAITAGLLLLMYSAVRLGVQASILMSLFSSCC